MNWNLFWGLFVLAFAAACLIVAYALGWRSTQKEKRCSGHTKGTVVRYSAVQYNGVSLPVVKYTVDGREYKVVGPHFKAGVVKSYSTPFNSVITEQKSNINSDEPLPDVIKISRKKNSVASITVTPLKERYPIGAEADVYYDPKKPKRAYVERYAGTILFLSLWLPLIFGIGFTVLGFYLMFGPTIVM